MTSSSTTAVRVTRIEAARGLIPLNLGELWEYRELLFFMLARDIKGKYRQMAFGPLWMVINPIMNVVLFSIVFGVVAQLPSDGIPYPLFNYSAMLPWMLFSGTVFAAAGSLTGQKHLISKVYFPRLILPLVGVLSALVDFAISFVLLLALGLYYGYAPGWTSLMVPIYLLLAGAAGLAIGLWFAGWIAHFNDVNAILGYIIRLWMYATPVVYASSMVPERYMALYKLNPLTTVVEGMRWALYGVGEGSISRLLTSFAIVIPLLIGGAYYFRRAERSIVDVA